MEEKISVVLADVNEEFRLALQQAAEATDEFSIVGSTGDGAEALRLVMERKPDLLVSELILPSLDGLTLLDRMNENAVGTQTMIVSALCHPQAIAQAMERRIAFFLPKPCELPALLDRMRQAAVCAINAADEEFSRLEYEVSELLRDVGMAAHTAGYRFVRAAIILAAQDMSLIDTMTKGLYPAVACRFHTSPSRVERSLRSAIASAWERGDPERLQYYFGYTVSSSKGKPTNSEFIAMLADLVRLQRKAAVRG